MWATSIESEIFLMATKIYCRISDVRSVMMNAMNPQRVLLKGAIR